MHEPFPIFRATRRASSSASQWGRYSCRATNLTRRSIGRARATCTTRSELPTDGCWEPDSERHFTKNPGAVLGMRGLEEFAEKVPQRPFARQQRRRNQTPVAESAHCAAQPISRCGARPVFAQRHPNPLPPERSANVDSRRTLTRHQGFGVEFLLSLDS